MIRNGILHPREFTAAKSTVAGLRVLSPGFPSQAHSPGIPPSIWKMGLFLPAWPSGAKGQTVSGQWKACALWDV